MKNNSWKCFREEKPEEKKWILVKIAYSDAELKEMELEEDFQKQDYYSFTNEEWKYIK